MKYIIEDYEGQTFPIINLIDRNDNETDDIFKAVSIVVRTPEGTILPVIADECECPFTVYRIH